MPDRPVSGLRFFPFQSLSIENNYKKNPCGRALYRFRLEVYTNRGVGGRRKKIKKGERERESEREIDDPITRVFEKEERQDGKVKR